MKQVAIMVKMKDRPKVLRDNIIKQHLNAKRYRAKEKSKELKYPCQYNWFNNMQMEPQLIILRKVRYAKVHSALSD